MDDNQLLRYSRQIMLPQVDVAGQQTLLDSRTLIIGAGGLGSPAAMYLAAAGVGDIAIADPDTVEISNLQRQLLHGSSDLGRTKSVSAQDTLNAINSDVQVTALEARLSSEALSAQVQQADIVLDCVTNERSLNQAVGLLRRAGTLAVVGVPPRDAALPMPVIQDWEIRVQGCAAYTEADVRTSVDIAVSGGLPTDEIVSGIYGLHDLETAFTQAKADSSGKVMVAPQS